MAFAAGDRDASRLVARYDVRTSTDRPLPLELVLAVRPFQVNPPAQFLNTAGGVSRSPTSPGTAQRVAVNAQPQGVPPDAAGRVGTFPFAAGPSPRTARDAGLDGPRTRSATSSAMPRRRSATA